MQLKTIIYLILLFSFFCSIFGFSQDDTTRLKKVQLEKSYITTGYTYGIHPNFKPSKSNVQAYFFETENEISVLGRKISVSGRCSNEPLRSGTASYFSFNLIPQKLNIKELNRLKNQLNLNQKSLDFLNDTLHQLNEKISFLKQQEIEKIQLQLDSTGLPDPSGIHVEKVRKQFSDTTLKPSEHIHDVDELLSHGFRPKFMNDSAWVNAIQKRQELEDKALSIQNKITEQHEKIRMDSIDLSQVNDGKSLRFPGSISTLNLGLSSLSKGSLGSNTLPIHGLKIGGDFKKLFYEFSCGVTIKNQLFSNLSFDQFIDKNGNLFNANSFSSINSNRLVASSILGFGTKNYRYISYETFYTGKTINDLRGKDTSGKTVQQTIQQLGFKTPLFKSNKLTIDGSLGICLNDTNKQISNNNIAYRGTLKYQLSSQTLLSYTYKNIGTHFDGWSQGIQQRGLEHHDVTFRFKLGKSIRIGTTLSSDKYVYFFEKRTNMFTKSLSTNWDQKIGKKIIWTNSYTFLELVQKELKPTYNHLARTGIVGNLMFDECQLIMNSNFNYVQLNSIDSSVSMQSGDLKGKLSFGKIHIELGGSYFDNKGTSRLAGKILNLQTGVGGNFKRVRFDLNYVYSKSQQFDVAHGFKLKVNLHLMSFLHIETSAQKWLPSEYMFFGDATVIYQNPYYIQSKLILSLIPQKK